MRQEDTYSQCLRLASEMLSIILPLSTGSQLNRIETSNTVGQIKNRNRLCRERYLIMKLEVKVCALVSRGGEDIRLPRKMCMMSPRWRV